MTEIKSIPAELQKFTPEELRAALEVAKKNEQLGRAIPSKIEEGGSNKPGHSVTQESVELALGSNVVSPDVNTAFQEAGLQGLNTAEILANPEAYLKQRGGKIDAKGARMLLESLLSKN